MGDEEGRGLLRSDSGRMDRQLLFMKRGKTTRMNGFRFFFHAKKEKKRATLQCSVYGESQRGKSSTPSGIIAALQDVCAMLIRCVLLKRFRFALLTLQRWKDLICASEPKSLQVKRGKRGEKEQSRGLRHLFQLVHNPNYYATLSF